MKLRGYKGHTFALCMAWYHRPTARNRQRLILNLERWARAYCKGAMEDYGYEEGARDWVFYCSDRMNPGRAKACLRLLHDQYREMILEAMQRFEDAAAKMIGGGQFRSGKDTVVLWDLVRR